MRCHRRLPSSQTTEQPSLFIVLLLRRCPLIIKPTHCREDKAKEVDTRSRVAGAGALCTILQVQGHVSCAEVWREDRRHGHEKLVRAELTSAVATSWWPPMYGSPEPTAMPITTSTMMPNTDSVQQHTAPAKSSKHVSGVPVTEGEVGSNQLSAPLTEESSTKKTNVTQQGQILHMDCCAEERTA